MPVTIRIFGSLMVVLLAILGTLSVAVTDVAAIAGTIRLTVNCSGNPELTTITNNTDEALPLGTFTLGSLYQSRTNEPFRLGNTLRLPPNESITFQTGSAATSPTALTNLFIYDDNAPTEGARLTTPYGTLDVLCSARIGTLTVGAVPPTPPSGEGCFAETGKCISPRFLAYWLANGGLAQQGLPLSDEFMEVNPTDGKRYPTQYFERSRFEYHEENRGTRFEVLLGLIGREQYLAKYPGDNPGPTVPPAPGQECARFQETGRTVCGPFLAYWRANGALTQQGLPLTEAFNEVNPTNGQTYLTQYFERSRMEYHPENQDPRFQVLLGLIGREQFLAKYPSGNPNLPAPPATTWGPTLAPLAGGKGYTDPRGRFSFSVPQDWTQETSSDVDVLFVAPRNTPAVMAVDLIPDLPAGLTVEALNQELEEELKTSPGYVLVSIEKVLVGPQQAYKRVFTATASDGTVLQFELVYFIANRTAHVLTFATLPTFFARLASTFDGIAGSYRVLATSARAPSSPSAAPNTDRVLITLDSNSTHGLPVARRIVATIVELATTTKQ